VEISKLSIKYLRAKGYDYLSLCHADGIHDDSKIMQMRIDAGLNPFESKKSGKNKHLIKNTLYIPSDFNIDGK
jgi:hypothetical protein